MPVVSKSQSSGSDSDSAERMVNKKTGKSQRQASSSSTSAFSSDSEPEQSSARPSAEKPADPPSPKKKPDSQLLQKRKTDVQHSHKKKLETSESEQVSTRPVAEKLTAPSSPKKKSSGTSLLKKKTDALPSPRKKSEASLPEEVSAGPAAEKAAPPPPLKKISSHTKKSQSPPSPKRTLVASVISAVREGTPSEQNPKVPSSSNLKRVAAKKEAKDAAEEQPQPKKKSTSKGKRPLEGEAEPSNPKKKKQRKQQQESVEFKDGLKGFLKDVKKLLENSEARMRALLNNYSGSANGTLGGAGAVVNSTALFGNRDPDLEGVYSNRGFPVVEEDKVQLMKAKWRAFQIRELDVKKQRFELLQEENFLQKEALEKQSCNGTSH